jgi:hypothetical protein
VGCRDPSTVDSLNVLNYCFSKANQVDDSDIHPALYSCVTCDDFLDYKV